MDKTLAGFGVLAMLLLVALPGSAQPSGGFQLIVNAENLVIQASRDEISDMFLKKSQRWDDGAAVMPINLESDAAARVAFSQAIHGRSVANIESYWQQQIFSGRAKPPLVVADDAQMVAHVSRNRGAIGYVSTAAQLSGVRTLSVATLPERLSYVQPEYSATARRARVAGEVVLEVSLDEGGNVTGATAIKELGFGLTQKAIEAVMQWKYKPATVDGQPVPVVISVSLRFGPPSG